MSMLLTEQNTKKVGNLVLKAARVKFRTRKVGQSHFEHGQWWYCHPDGSQYSVVDSEPSIANTGLDFEQVSKPYDE
jgi:hypothetical protein